MGINRNVFTQSCSFNGFTAYAKITSYEGVPSTPKRASGYTIANEFRDLLSELPKDERAKLLAESVSPQSLMDALMVKNHPLETSIKLISRVSSINDECAGSGKHLIFQIVKLMEKHDMNSQHLKDVQKRVQPGGAMEEAWKRAQQKAGK